MSLNKARKRLIRKYRKMYNSMLETLTLGMLTQASCQLVKLALEILR